MDRFQFTVDMDQATTETLRDGHFALFGLHALATSGQGAPAIWLTTYYLERHMTVTWHDSYSLFTAPHAALTPGLIVRPTHRYPARLGSALAVAGDDGQGTISPTAPAGHLEIANLSGTQLSAGVCVTDSRGQDQPCGLFSLFGHTTEIMQPVPKAAFFFSPIPHQTGELVDRAISPGVLVDFTGAIDNKRSCTYNFETGWNFADQPWGRQIAAREPLAPLLLLRSPVLQALAMQRQRAHTA